MIIKCTYLREALKKYIKNTIYRCVLILTIGLLATGSPFWNVYTIHQSRETFSILLNGVNLFGIALSVSMSSLFVMAKEYNIIIIVYSYCKMSIGFRDRYNSNEMWIKYGLYYFVALSYDNGPARQPPLK